MGGAEVGYIEDDEETFEQLYSRLESTIEILKSLSPTSMDGEDNREIIAKAANMGTYSFPAMDYVLNYAIPNFHFHLSTGYCIMRTLGVPLSAFDYLDSDKKLFVKID